MLNTNKLGKEFKLITPGSFQKVFKNARKFRHLGISVLVCKNNLPCSRLGICVPKKQVPRAVDRNRIKRIIRESFRVKRKDLETHLDMVFLVYSKVLEQRNDEILACLDYLWIKLTGFYRSV